MASLTWVSVSPHPSNYKTVNGVIGDGVQERCHSAPHFLNVLFHETRANVPALMVIRNLGPSERRVSRTSLAYQHQVQNVCLKLYP